MQARYMHPDEPPLPILKCIRLCMLGLLCIHDKSPEGMQD